jgi:hypothetical protein
MKGVRTTSDWKIQDKISMEGIYVFILESDQKVGRNKPASGKQRRKIRESRILIRVYHMTSSVAQRMLEGPMAHANEEYRALNSGSSTNMLE